MHVSLLPFHYGPVVKNLTLTFCPKIISWLLRQNYPCYVNDISRNYLLRYFCGTSDTSDTSNTCNTADLSDASKTNASVTRLSSYFVRIGVRCNSLSRSWWTWLFQSINFIRRTLVTHITNERYTPH